MDNILKDKKKLMGIALFIVGIIIIVIAFKTYKDTNRSNKNEDSPSLVINVVEDDEKPITCEEAMGKGSYKRLYYEPKGEIITFEFLNCVTDGTYINGDRVYGTNDGVFSVTAGYKNGDLEDIKEQIIEADKLDGDDYIVQLFDIENDKYDALEIVELVPYNESDLDKDIYVEGTILRSRLFTFYKINDDKYLVISVNLGNEMADDAFMMVIDHIIDSIDIEKMEN